MSDRESEERMRREAEEREMDGHLRDIGAVLNGVDHYDKCLVLATALMYHLALMGETSLIFSWPHDKLAALREGLNDIGESLEIHRRAM